MQVAFSTHEGKLPSPGASKQQQQQSDEDSADVEQQEEDAAAAADGPTPMESVMSTCKVRPGTPCSCVFLQPAGGGSLGSAAALCSLLGVPVDLQRQLLRRV
jgi:hypothetical protein